MTFLEGEVENEQRISLAMRGFQGASIGNSVRNDRIIKKKNKSGFEEIPTAAGLVSIKEKIVCIFCEQDHESCHCEYAKTITLEERQRLVEIKNGCFNCLKTGHDFKRCRYNQKCAWCQRRHVLLICRELKNKQVNVEQASVVEKDLSVKKTSLSTMLRNPEIFLQTLRVKLCNGKFQCIVRVALDSCSHRSYILTSVANRIQYKSLGQQRMIHLLFGGSRTEPQYHKGYDIHVSSLDEKFKCNFIALSGDVIVEDIPCINDGPWIKELRKKGVLLSDFSSVNEPISILIGADFLGKLQTGRLFETQSGPTAIETKLGWTLTGEKSTEVGEPRVDTVLVVTTMFVRDAKVSDLWNLDILGITDPTETKSREEHQTEIKRQFQESTTIDGEGRYQVCLPWRENHPPLQENQEASRKRLLKTTSKLKDRNLFEEYGAVFEEWEKDGVIEKVPSDEILNKGHYLPHRPVIKEGSTTRLRPVFDASAESKNFLSLNQCLETGPNLIELIPTIIKKLQKSFYVDICLASFDTMDEGLLFKEVASEVMQEMFRSQRVGFFRK